MILILTWPRLSWTICLVSGRETLRKKKNETPIWKINHQWRRMRWKMKLEYLQIEADRGRLAGEQGGGSWSSILPSPHCTWNIFCWSFLDCAIAHALPVCPGFSQGQLPGALLVDLALLVGNQLPFLLWNFFIFSQYFFCWSLLWVRQYPVGFTSMLKILCCSVCRAKIMVHIRCFPATVLSARCVMCEPLPQKWRPHARWHSTGSQWDRSPIIGVLWPPVVTLSLVSYGYFW